MAPDMQHPYLTHPLTGEPIVAIGRRRNGQPIWPVIGAAEDGEDGGDTDDGDGDEQDGDTGGTDDLGDAGKAAIDRMKAQRNAAKTEARQWRALATEVGVSSVDELRAKLFGGKPKAKDDAADDKPDAEQIRRDARREAQQSADARIVRAEVKAAAGGKLADPADAVKLLDLTHFELDEDGNLDEDEVADAIADLLRRKPYLAAASKNDDDEGSSTRRRRAPRPDRSQGSRGSAVSDSREQALEQLARRGYARTTQ
jgi:hypothetical protein